MTRSTQSAVAEPDQATSVGLPASEQDHLAPGLSDAERINILEQRFHQLMGMFSQQQELLVAQATLLAQRAQDPQAAPRKEGPPLEPAAVEQARQRAFWASEPTIRTVIPMDQWEQEVAMRYGGQFPLVITVNGTQFCTWKGVMIDVPESLFRDVIEHMLNPWKGVSQEKPKSFEELWRDSREQERLRAVYGDSNG